MKQNRRKIYIRMCALLMVVMLVGTNSPVTLYAQEKTLSTQSSEQLVDPPISQRGMSFLPDTDTINAENSLDTFANDIPLVTPICEIEDLREESIKHFDMGNGIYQAVSYGEPVHRKDNEGKWQDIDNRLFATSAQKSTYATKDGRITMAASAGTKQNLLTLSENGYTLTMTPQILLRKQNEETHNALLIQNHVDPATKSNTAETFEDFAKVENTTTVRYADVFDETDIEYIFSANVIKENIIVHQAQEAYRYAFLVTTEGLYATLCETGEIVFYDNENDNMVYVMPAPYMYDNNGIISYAVEYQLTSVIGGYLVEVVADKAWLNQESRAFPIVIDPTIEGYSSIIDTYINSAAPTSKYGSSTQLWVSSSRITFIRSVLPTLPEGSELYSATIHAYYYYYDSITSGNTIVSAHKVLNSWTENALTWNSANQNTNMGISTSMLSIANLRGTAGAYENSPVLASWGITSAAEEWYETPSSNYGIALKYYSGNNPSVILCSREKSTRCPYLTVSYRILNGVYAIQKHGTALFVRDRDEVASVGQKALTRVPNTKDDIEFLFKIAYRQNTNDYVIRSMVNNKMVLCYSSFYHTPRFEALSAADGDISSDYTWNITEVGFDLYKISHTNSQGTYYLQSVNNEDTTVLSTTTSESDASTWSFMHSRNVFSNLYCDNILKQIVTSGDTLDLSSLAESAVYYSTEVGDNSIYPVSFSVSNLSGSDTSIASISNSGILRTVAGKVGVVSVKVTAAKGQSFTKNFFIKPQVEEYFFWQNTQGNNSMYIEADNTTTQTGDFSYDDCQIWQWSQQDSDWFLIKNVNTGKYLKSPNNGTVGSDVLLGKISSEVDKFLWKKEITANGAVKIQSKYMNLNYPTLYLAVDATTGALEQKVYTNDSIYNDEFRFLWFGSDVVFHRTLDGFRPISPSNLLHELSPYFDSFTLLHPLIHFGVSSPDNKNTALAYLEESKVMIFNSHGLPTEIAINDNPQKKLRNVDIYTSDADHADLSGVDLVIFAGCFTAGIACSYCNELDQYEEHLADCPNRETEAYNLPESAIEAGAKVAIGWRSQQEGNEMNDWIDMFLGYMNSIDSSTNQLYTAQKAVELTNDNCEHEITQCAVFYGDENYRFSD